jgi:hypothetical protein
LKSVAVSYWSGKLIIISQLHFKSFKYNNDYNSRYILYLDVNTTPKFKIPKALYWILNKPWFELKFFSLKDLMTRNKFLILVTGQIA